MQSVPVTLLHPHNRQDRALEDGAGFINRRTFLVSDSKDGIMLWRKGSNFTFEISSQKR